MEKIKTYFKELWKILRLPEMLILPGNLAFFLVLSIAPLITLFGMIASILPLSTENILNFFNNVFPSGVAEIFVSFFEASKLNTGNITFLIIGFYVSSNGIDSLIKAANILYKNENENYFKRKIKALFMNFWVLLLFVIIIILLAFGSFILTKLLSFSIIGKFIMNNYAIITLIKLLVSFLIIFLTIKIIYTMVLNNKVKTRYVNRGALFATLSIMIVTSIYSFYVTNIAHYDVVYGSLATIATLMLLIYFISYIIVLGMAINYNYYQINE